MPKSPAPRGGKRDGAGRPRVLSEIQSIEIGAFCENEWNGERHKEGFGGFDALPSRPKTFADLVKTIPEGLSVAKQMAARQQIGRAVFGDRSRVYRVRLPRPRGGNVRRDIMRAGVAYAREKFGVEITERLVETCWKNYRAFLKDELPPAPADV